MITENLPACPMCGQRGTLRAVAAPITVKRRVKFGVFWVLATVLTGGLAFFVWLMMPRYNQQIAVDRYMVCSACGSRT